MTKKFKINVALMITFGAMYLHFKSLDVQTPGIEKMLLILQIITLVAFGMSTIILMFGSTES